MAAPGKRAEISLVELEKLSVLHCSDQELADWFGVTTRTIERRRKEPEFAAAMARGRSRGKINVRRMQMQLLERGNATMAIWLGKQLLGQSDRVESKSDQPLIVIRENNGGSRPLALAEPDCVTLDISPRRASTFSSNRP